jgi:hypothetical protein
MIIEATKEIESIAVGDKYASLANKKLLTDQQRRNLIAQKGEPLVSVEFDFWPDGSLSMWNHMPHGKDFDQVTAALVAMRDRLAKFIEDGPAMCPFSPKFKGAEMIGCDGQRPKILPGGWRQ